MAELLWGDEAPPIKLCESIMIIGASPEKLPGKGSSVCLIEGKLDTQPELIAVIPTAPQRVQEQYMSIPSVSATQLIFPEGNIRFSVKPRYPVNYSFTLTDQDRRRSWLHCLKIYERINPEIAIESSLASVLTFPKRNKKSISQFSLGAMSPTGGEPASPFALSRQSSDAPEISVYVPVVLCILTKLEYNHAFRQVLEALYDYIYDIKSGCIGVYGAKEAHAVANMEFLRYALFLVNDVVCPPKFTNMELKIGPRVVRFPADCWAELPHYEPCITVLMDLVDVSKIIDMWLGLLLERQIVIMSRQDLVQFAICEAMRMLIYPLKWSHVYIPIVGEVNLPVLESPVPYLIGVSNQFISFEEVVVLAPSSIVLDLDSGKFVCGKMPRVCVKEENKLRQKIYALKSRKYQYIDQAHVSTVPSEVTVLSEEEKGCQFRNAFMDIFVCNLQHYQACIIHDKDKFRYEFSHKTFITHLLQCGEPKCKSTEFWTAVAETSLFADFVGDSTTFDESNTSNFNMILDKLFPVEKSRYGVATDFRGYESDSVTITLKPFFPPKVFFQRLIHQSAASEDRTPESQSQSRQHFMRIECTVQLQNLSETLAHLPYFTSEGEDGLNQMLTSSKPQILKSDARYGRRFSTQDQETGTIVFVKSDSQGKVEANSNLLYSAFGLIRFCAYALGSMTPVHMAEVNAWEEMVQWLEQLNGDQPHWQYFLMLSYVFEFMKRDENSRLELVLKAYELNQNSLPTYRFTQLLENLGSADPDILQRLKSYHGRANDIVKKVEDLLLRERATADLVTKSVVTVEKKLTLELPETESLGLLTRTYTEADLTPTSGGFNRKGKRRKTIEGFGHKPAELQNLLIIKPESLNDSMMWNGGARPIGMLVEELVITMIELIESIRAAKPKCLVVKEKRQTLKGMINSSEIWANLQTNVCELQDSVVPPVTEENKIELLSFFLNLHNLTVLFAIFKKLKFPDKGLEWMELLSKSFMKISGTCISPLLIQTRVLRSCFMEGMHSRSGDTDMDCPWEFPTLNPLVNFGLYLPASFSPPLRVFRTHSVMQELEGAARSYVERNANMEIGNQGEYIISVPPLFSLKKSDFGTDENVKKFIMDNGEENVSKLLSSKKSAKIRYQIRDWNFVIRPEDIVPPE